MVEVSAVPETSPVENPKLSRIFSSIEKQLIAQTGFLKSMQGLQSSQVKFTKDMVSDAERRRMEEMVSEGDTAPQKTKVDVTANQGSGSTKDAGSGIGMLSKALTGAGIAALAAKVLGGGILAIMAPVISSFISGAVEKSLTLIGVDEGFAEDIANATNTAVEWGIWGKLLFGKKGGIAGLLMGIGSHLGSLFDRNKDGIVEFAGYEVTTDTFNQFGTILGLAVTPLLMGIASKLSIGIKSMTTFLTDKATAALTSAKRMIGMAKDAAAETGKRMLGAGSDAAKRMLGTGAKADSIRPGAKPSVPTSGKPASVIPKTTLARSIRPGKLPSSMKYNSAGRAIDAATGRFQSIEQIMDAMKAEGKMAQLAKYSKFLKFAGPAMAVIPALIEPAMSIYNKESDDVIKTQIAGALGSIGGGALGAIVGGAALSFIPGVGTIVGAIAGGVGGALGGEYLIEELVESLLGGPSAKPIEKSYGSYDNDIGSVGGSRETQEPPSPSKAYRRQNDKLTPILPPKQGSGLTSSFSLSPVIPMTGKLNQLDAGLQVSKRSSESSVNVANTSGGNTSNTTSIGGSSTTFNVFQSSGAGALSNNLPRPMASS